MIDVHAAAVARAPRLSMFGLLAVLAVGIVMLAWPVRVDAHGESVNVSPSEAKPGDSVTLTGEEFPPGEEVRFTLEGVKDTVPLGHAEAGDDGSFTATVDVPPSATPGSYQLVAATSDDNIVLDFTVLRGTAESGPAGQTTLTFERSTAETIAIGLITAALILGGTILVRSSTRRHA